MTVNHLFIIDPLASLNLALDSSLRMMFSLFKKGHSIWVCEPRQLYWVAPNVVAACRAIPLSFSNKAQHPESGAEETCSLTRFQAIHMRKDPPYDLDYITTTWLLDSAAKTAKIYNDPNALRTYNEKLLIFKFPQHSKPALYSANIDNIVGFIKETANGDGILKPLHLFGGRGVQRLLLKNDRDETTVRKLLTDETSGGTSARLIQPFDSSIFSGEVRVFTAFGVPLAWCLKKPAAGEYLANTRTGATLHRYEPSANDVARVSEVAAALNKLGMPIVGFDMIGGFISEVNITSPRLLQAPEDTENYYEIMASLFCKDLSTKK